MYIYIYIYYFTNNMLQITYYVINFYLFFNFTAKYLFQIILNIHNSHF